ncbi:hypothetical protein [Candidatus Methylomicrobium oryzae]|uniref:hypothetical protein n=1 Tax=Candidatus Methylomicrobium oryzae TaxID=2802053 RepID=UPI001922180F|nr:hypothetical protein [Methylomicrobium sp. RS1]MBL1264524.1 hypothetical protein [Methylomicrobium sp. RS1]
MTNDLEKKHEEELWAMWGNYITAAGRIKKEIDRRQRIPPFKRPGFKKPQHSR